MILVKTMRKLILISALLASTVLSWAQGPGRPPATVVVANAQQQNLSPATWYAGQVLSKNDAKLAAEIAARVDSIVDIGTQVEQGEIIAQLDKTFIRQELIEHEAVAAQEQARLKLFNKEVKRLTRLAKKNNAAQRQLDQAISDRAVSQGVLKAAQARADRAREELKRSEIRAPFAGVVAERYKQQGEWIDNGESLVRLVDPHTVEIQTRVPVTSLAHVQSGDELRLRQGEQIDLANIISIVPVGDDRSRLYELRLMPKSKNWFAGQTLRVAVPNAAARVVTTVPRDALVLRRDGVRVFRVKQDNTAEMVTVRTGMANGADIEVIGDVQPGDAIVTRGGERLRSGAPVKVLSNTNSL